MQKSLFTNELSAFPSHHKGLRGEMMLCIELFYNTHKRLPMPAQRGLKGSDNDRETILESESLQKWKTNSKRATYSWALRYLILEYSK